MVVQSSASALVVVAPTLDWSRPTTNQKLAGGLVIIGGSL